MKIKSYKYGILHAYAQCDNCEWDTAIDIEQINRMQHLRRNIYVHILKTKHTVTLKTGNTTRYFIDYYNRRK